MALQRAVPRPFQAAESISQHLEQHTEGLAEYTVTVACGGMGHRTCQVERTLTLNGGVLTPRLFGRRAHLGSKRGPAGIRIVLGGQMAIAMSRPASFPRRENRAGSCADQTVLSLAGERRTFDTPAAGADWQRTLIAAEQVPGPAVHLRPVAQTEAARRVDHRQKKVLFIRVDFSDLEGNPLNDEATMFSMNRTNKFLEDNSYGKLTIDTTLVPGVLRMPKPAAWYQGRAGKPRRQVAGSRPRRGPLGWREIQLPRL
ncbi:MAG: hypothetical protein Ct9H300mP32_6790 [Verrucomicrobiota bacterium]|nr:MAG: hypothetical protein Ct9H300mP32_6790 [Verrucomicrobiota bacterium]